MSSVRGGISTTSGSDAGSLPSLRTAFICTSEEVVAALTIRPLPDSLDEALFTLLEQASREGQDPDPERFVRELADALFTHPLEGIDGLAELRDHVEDIDGEGLRTYVVQWIHSLGAGHGKRLLDQDAVAIIENYIPPMVSSVVLQNAFMKGLPSAPRLTKDYRWEQLSAKRELKSLCQSPFSKGWWNRSLQGHQAASVFRSPVSEISQTTPRREVRMSEGNGSPTKTSVGTSDPPDLVSQQRRHTAAKNADKAATAFDGGSFKGVADKRGFSGFWRQLEGKLLRRGSDHGSPEHFYMLTSLLPEHIVSKTVGRTVPKTLSAFQATVEDLRTALSREYDGFIEVEKLLTETLTRGANESLTDFIARIDNWEDRCSTAGSPVPDATLIQVYRSGVSHGPSREASYEYPCRWTDFRLRALTRAARFDGEKCQKPDTSSQEQPKSKTAPTPPSSQRPTIGWQPTTKKEKSAEIISEGDV